MSSVLHSKTEKGPRGDLGPTFLSRRGASAYATESVGQTESVVGDNRPLKP